MLVVSSKGFGKRSLLEEYREQKEAEKGVFTLKANKKTGKLISIMEVVNEDDLMIITDSGIMIRQSIERLNIIGRNTQGVKLLRLDEDSSIASVTKVIKEENEEEIEGDTPKEKKKNRKMLSDVNINTKSLKQINHNIQKYSNNPKEVKLIVVTKNLFSQINKQCIRK